MQKLILSISILFTCVAFSEDAKEAEHFRNAVKDTQALMLNKTQRDQVIKQTPDGQKAADKIKELAGDAMTEEEYYKLATEIFGNFKDEESMMKGISSGTRNPAEFYNSLTPDQKAKILELGKKIAPGAGLKNP